MITFNCDIGDELYTIEIIPHNVDHSFNKENPCEFLLKVQKLVVKEIRICRSISSSCFAEWRNYGPDVTANIHYLLFFSDGKVHAQNCIEGGYNFKKGCSYLVGHPPFISIPQRAYFRISDLFKSIHGRSYLQEIIDRLVITYGKDIRIYFMGTLVKISVV